MEPSPTLTTLDRSPGFGPLETVFEALGRVLVVLDASFRILRVSSTLDAIAGAGMSASVIGKPIEELVGSRLFGPTDSLRVALTQGRREEGRRAVLVCGEGRARLVSLTAAVVPLHVSNHCDPRARYLVVIRPAEDDDGLLQGILASHGLIARSPAMMRIVHLVDSLHESMATVLITGESGTGKELIARALHWSSRRGSGPFVGVNCGALPADLLESELFGHVKGAFTGALRDRVGRVETARGGTLFLDEIGDLPLPLQVKLLRLLQERQFERVGESTSRPMDARVIAATNRDLAHMVRVGSFREDLYYRLRVVPIHIPPLRERPEDVALIAQHLLVHVGDRAGRALRLSPDTVELLQRYPWPGNVRELENALEYAAALCSGQTVQIEDLPHEIQEHESVRPGAATEEPTPRRPGGAGGGALPPSIAAAHRSSGGAEAIRPASVHETPEEDGDDASDRMRIVVALENAHWNRQRAASALGMSRSTLWRRMRELGIE